MSQRKRTALQPGAWMGTAPGAGGPVDRVYEVVTLQTRLIATCDGRAGRKCGRVLGTWVLIGNGPGARFEPHNKVVVSIPEGDDPNDPRDVAVDCLDCGRVHDPLPPAQVAPLIQRLRDAGKRSARVSWPRIAANPL